MHTPFPPIYSDVSCEKPPPYTPYDLSAIRHTPQPPNHPTQPPIPPQVVIVREKRHSEGNRSCNCEITCMLLLCFILPPTVVYRYRGCGVHLLVNIILVFFIVEIPHPLATFHALYVMIQALRSTKESIDATKPPPATMRQP